MDKIIKLALAITTCCFTSIALGGPCYTDIGICNENDQMVVVKPTNTGAGFCVQTLNDKNEFESKCYYQAPQHKVAKVRQSGGPNINLVFSYSQSNEPIPVKYESGYVSASSYYNSVYEPSYGTVVTIVGDSSPSYNHSSYNSGGSSSSSSRDYDYNRYNSDYCGNCNRWNNNNNNNSDSSSSNSSSGGIKSNTVTIRR